MTTLRNVPFQFKDRMLMAVSMFSYFKTVLSIYLWAFSRLCVLRDYIRMLILVVYSLKSTDNILFRTESVRFSVCRT
jgi:hypothetical protein